MRKIYINFSVKRSILSIFTFFLLFSLHAQNAVWTGNVDNDWSNSSNWYPELPASGGTATVPSNPLGGVSPVISGNVNLDYTVQNALVITIDEGANVINSSFFINFDQGSVVNNGTFNNQGMVAFDNDGTFDNNGVFNNFGSLENGGTAGGAVFNNNVGAVFNNDGDIINNALFVNAGEFNNLPDRYFNNYRTIINTGSFNNYGTLEIWPCSKLIQDSDIDLTGDVWLFGIVYQIQGAVNIGGGDGVVLFSLDDEPAPTAICKNISVQLDENGAISVTPAEVNNGSSASYCFINSIELSPNTFDCSNVGQNEVELTVTDFLGNSSTCTAIVNVEASIFCEPQTEFCTLTQGFYGNPGGIQNGKTTLEIIQSALSDGPIVLGKNDRTLTVYPEAAACIIDLLPGGGNPGHLPENNTELDQDCDISPIELKNGRIDNILIAQVLTLSMNLRLDPALGNLPLNQACIEVSEYIMEELGENGTVNDLLELANSALGGEIPRNELSSIPNAIGDINDYFDECNSSCASEHYAASEDIFHLQALRDLAGVTLMWAATSQSPNDYFEVERYDANNNLAVITKTNCYPGYTDVSLTYEFFDDNPVKGMNFYRIKQVFEDGSSRYSNLREINVILDNKNNWVFPNPVSDEVYSNLREYAGMEANIQISNSLGQPIVNQHYGSLPDQLLKFNLDYFKNGIYTISVKVKGHKRLTTRFMVEKL